MKTHKLERHGEPMTKCDAWIDAPGGTYYAAIHWKYVTCKQCLKKRQSPHGNSEGEKK